MQTLNARQLGLAALGVILLTVATRLPSLLHPQPINDEVLFSVVANEIVDGGRPYVDAAERKPPLLFWLYAAVFEIAGKYNWKALHAASLLCTLFTMLGLYTIGKRLFDREAGLIAALLYSIFQAWWPGKNLTFQGELPMNLAVVWAYAIAFGRSSSRLRPELLAAGTLLCLGFLFKQTGAIAAVPLGIYLLLPSYRASRGLTLADSIIQTLMLTIGFFATLGLVAIIVWKQGIFGEAYYWTFTVNTVPHVFWDLAARFTLSFLIACLPLLIGAAMACRGSSGLWTGKKAELCALLGLVAVSAIGAASSARFYTHYYIPLIPPLALLAAPFYARLWFGRTHTRRILFSPALSYAWLALTVIVFSSAHFLTLASQREPSETGRYLAEHSAPADRIFVWGQKARIYLESRRRPASRYIQASSLTGHVFGGALPGVDTRRWAVPGAWNTLAEDFSKHPPVYIVDVQDDWRQPHPVEDFPIMAKLLAEKYRPIARTVDGVIYRLR